MSDRLNTAWRGQARRASAVALRQPARDVPQPSPRRAGVAPRREAVHRASPRPERAEQGGGAHLTRAHRPDDAPEITLEVAEEQTGTAAHGSNALAFQQGAVERDDVGARDHSDRQ